MTVTFHIYVLVLVMVGVELVSNVKWVPISQDSREAYSCRTCHEDNVTK